jgi:hypothetical protein
VKIREEITLPQQRALDVVVMPYSHEKTIVELRVRKLAARFRPCLNEVQARTQY